MTTTSDALRGNLVETKRSTGLWTDAFSRLRKNKLAMVGLAPGDPAGLPRDRRAVHRPVSIPGAGPPGRDGQRRATGQAWRPGTHPRDRQDRSGSPEPAPRRSAHQLYRRDRGPARRAWHRRADRRDGRLVRWPRRQPAHAVHRRDVRLPGPAVHHPAVGGIQRDGIRQSDGRAAARLRRHRPDHLGDRRAIGPRAAAVAQGDGVRRGRPRDRRVRPQDRHEAPAAQFRQPGHRRRSRSAFPPPSSPRRRSRTSGSAFSRRAPRGAVSSPRARNTSAPIPTSSSSRRSASQSR